MAFNINIQIQVIFGISTIMKGGYTYMSNFKFKTSTPKEVRRTLSTLVNLVANDEIDQKKANSIVYITNAILTSIRVDEQEKQIQELKQIVQEIQEKNE